MTDGNGTGLSGQVSIADEVEELKRRRNAVVLAHYYVPGEVQDLADHVGDSFYLAKLACTLDADVIVLAGVAFMGESAKLLNPERTVLLPEPAADCPMAHMASVAEVAKVRREHPGVAVACYVNSTAELKAASDVCVTSSNAARIVSGLAADEVYFIPDMNLGRYVAEKVPEKHVILNQGWCPRHVGISPEEVRSLAREHPGAPVLAHPECTPEVLDEADFVGSTSQIIEQARESDARELIILTVVGVAHELERACAGQGKRFLFPGHPPICPNMASVTPEKVRDCLRDMSGAVEVDAACAPAARRALERMLELAGR
ncbi:MAG: quinolinate synthase NadA [Atopobiaceae bacterium]|nr:quinolinate synthase NadA [Atopobiaceae bacterium]MCI2173367.1 quinolinate synthase NadA [Atopobiaceae bacterium]MCI2207362.1 quinolinate synthase NadA [Atopobiaceae bacterium]